MRWVKECQISPKNQFIKHEYHWKYEYQNVAACELLMLEMCRYPKQCWFSFEIFLCSTRDILHHLTQKFSLFTSSYLFLALKYFTIPMFLSIYFEEANPECLFKKLWRVRVQSEHTTLHAWRFIFRWISVHEKNKINLFFLTQICFFF